MVLWYHTRGKSSTRSLACYATRTLPMPKVNADLMKRTVLSSSERRIWLNGGRSIGRCSRTLYYMAYNDVNCSVDTEQLDSSFAGREINANFLKELPPGVDPSGENGEFHTFVFDGPIFSKPIQFTKGDIILRMTGFMLADLIDR